MNWRKTKTYTLLTAAGLLCIALVGLVVWAVVAIVQKQDDLKPGEAAVARICIAALKSQDVQVRTKTAKVLNTFWRTIQRGDKTMDRAGRIIDRLKNDPVNSVLIRRRGKNGFCRPDPKGEFCALFKQNSLWGWRCWTCKKRIPAPTQLAISLAERKYSGCYSKIDVWKDTLPIVELVVCGTFIKYRCHQDDNRWKCKELPRRLKMVERPR